MEIVTCFVDVFFGFIEASTTQVPWPSFETDDNFLEWQLVHGSKFHLGVGCDMCGVISFC